VGEEERGEGRVEGLGCKEMREEKGGESINFVLHYSKV
jgi:hypothetical protein